MSHYNVGLGTCFRRCFSLHTPYAGTHLSAPRSKQIHPIREFPNEWDLNTGALDPLLCLHVYLLVSCSHSCLRRLLRSNERDIYVVTSNSNWEMYFSFTFAFFLLYLICVGWVSSFAIFVNKHSLQFVALLYVRLLHACSMFNGLNHCFSSCMWWQKDHVPSNRTIVTMGYQVFYSSGFLVCWFLGWFGVYENY